MTSKADTLKRLIDETPSVGDMYVKRYLVNNAEAIAELIEAAEMVSHTTTDSKASGYLAEAIAKIKE